MKILAIETSCDETAVAIVKGTGNIKKPGFSLLSHGVASQIALHKKWGGVVPNLAKREHQKHLVPLLLQALREAALFSSKHKARSAKSQPQTQDSLSAKRSTLNAILEREPELLEQFKKNIVKLPAPDIDVIAVTQGPGLEPALWVGVNFTRALSFWWDKPLIGINHMEGHVAIALLQEPEENPKAQTPNPKKTRKSKSPKPVNYKLPTINYPAIALLVSGGHTELVLMKKSLRYQIIGETRDDAVGEAFDKVARILGLSYPGGPEISREAEKLPTKNYKLQTKLPRPMISSKDFDFSFSGLKTAVLYLVRDLKESGNSIKKLRTAIAKEFQNAVVEVLTAKTIRAIKNYKARAFILSGGVAANKELRNRLSQEIKQNFPHTTYYLPPTTLTGDNGLMIASTAYLQLLHNKNLASSKQKTTRSTALTASWKTMRPDANMRLQ